MQNTIKNVKPWQLATNRRLPYFSLTNNSLILQFVNSVCTFEIPSICFIAKIAFRRKVNSKLYIRNLLYSITENELRTLFAMAGTVILVDIIKDRVSGRSKGYGFIQMSTPVEAENAVEMFDGWSMDSCKLRVGLTQHRERRGSFQNLATKDARRLSPRRGYIHSQ